MPKQYFKREKRAVLLLIFDVASIEEKYARRIYVSIKFYHKASALKNTPKAIDINDNVTDDCINTENEFTKIEDHIKRDKTKNACITEIFEIPMNKEHKYNFTGIKIYHR